MVKDLPRTGARPAAAAWSRSSAPKRLDHSSNHPGLRRPSARFGRDAERHHPGLLQPQRPVAAHGASCGISRSPLSQRLEQILMTTAPVGRADGFHRPGSGTRVSAFGRPGRTLVFGATRASRVSWQMLTKRIEDFQRGLDFSRKNEPAVSSSSHLRDIRRFMGSEGRQGEARRIRRTEHHGPLGEPEAQLALPGDLAATIPRSFESSGMRQGRRPAARVGAGLRPT